MIQQRAIAPDAITMDDSARGLSCLSALLMRLDELNASVTIMSATDKVAQTLGLLYVRVPSLTSRTYAV